MYITKDEIEYLKVYFKKDGDCSNTIGCHLCIINRLLNYFQQPITKSYGCGKYIERLSPERSAARKAKEVLYITNPDILMEILL